MASKILSLDRAITAHSWNGDGTRLAICANDNKVLIYRRSGTSFNLETTLEEHTQTVMGIDWAPVSGYLLTCAQDRNAYVWAESGGVWEPTLVILRINRAATACRWCPNEMKFAVTSGSKSVSICYYEEEQHWYISKHIKKTLKSTVTCVDWCHDNNLIVCGATDRKARIFCAAVKGVDRKPAPTAWGGKMSFGECIAEFDFGTSWVHDVTFSPSGEKIGFVSHDSSVVIVEANGNVCHIRTSELPYKSIIFLTDNTLLVGGFDANVTSYSGQDGGQWDMQAKLDSEKKTVAKKTGTSAAFAKFAAADRLGTSRSDAINTTLKTTHQNAITEMRVMGESGSISTCGADGQLVEWPLNAISSQISGFNIV